MGHNIEYANGKHNVFVVKEPAWHQLGIVIPNAVNSEEAIKLAGLDETIVKVPAKYEHDGELLIYPDKYVTKKESSKYPLGLVGKEYTIVQNIEAFKFLDEIVGSKQAVFHTAGALAHGERVFITMKLPDSMHIKGVDTIDKYIIFTNGHNGQYALDVIISPIRVVCQNTLMASFRNNSYRNTLYHTKNIHNQLEIVQKTLKATHKYFNEYEEVMDNLTKEFIQEDQLIRYTQSLILTKPELNLSINNNLKIKSIEEISTVKKNQIDLLLNSILNGVGQDSFIGSKYWLLNGVTYYTSNVLNYKDESKRFNSVVNGTTSKFVQNAYNKLLTL